MRVFLRLAYNGKNFHGWQKQPNAISVQQVLEDALGVMLQREVPIVGAGRTDTGVHAREMFAHLDLPEYFDLKNNFLTSLNRMVGKDIAVYEILPVKDEAHARFDALMRTYRYYIVFEKDPFFSDFSLKLERKPDLEAMNNAARKLLKISDFTSFAKLHSDAVTNICNVTKAEWQVSPQRNGIIFTITADRFLRNMVRSIVGTLLDVGFAKKNLDSFVKILEAKDRCAAGISAPAQGLFLEKIEYPHHIFQNV